MYFRNICIYLRMYSTQYCGVKVIHCHGWLLSMSSVHMYSCLYIDSSIVCSHRRRSHLQWWAVVRRWKLVEREAGFASTHGEWWKVRENGGDMRAKFMYFVSKLFAAQTGF